MENTERCANCNDSLAGEYCNQCGERRLERDRLRLVTFIRTALEEITDLENSKLLRTLRLLVLQPGVLTNEYLRGRRQSFIGPIKIYLVVFAVSFLLYSIYGPTSVYDVRTFIASDPTGVWKEQVQKLVGITHLTEPVLLDEVNARWRRYLNLTQAIYPLSIALMLQILYWRTRRYFAEHLILALHFSSIALGVNIVMWPVYALIGLQLDVNYYVSTSILLLLIFAWLLIASRRVYGASWLVSTIKTLLVEVAYYLVGMLITFLTLGWAIFTLVRSH